MLNPSRISEIIRDCFFHDDEVVDGKPIAEPVVVKGITHTFGFHPSRIESHRDEIVSLLQELPEKFYDGGSFLEMCYDKHGNLWTGMHQSCEELFVLGSGIGKAEFLADRDFWVALPGGMPYIKITI